MLTSAILTTKSSKGYELLDSGDNMKLERFGDVVVSRPDPQALWKKGLDEKKWQSAEAVFFQSGQKAHWKVKGDLSKNWKAEIEGLVFNIKLSSFKHTGVFPEQVSNWKFIEEVVSQAVGNGKKVSVLNLFGYTGGATMAAAKAGAEVCHVDGSKTAISLAKENAESSGLKDRPIRWILDDARKFVEREAKRGKKYDGIIMDPPAFGRGGKGEIWNIEKDFLPLLDVCKKVLSEKPLFVIINGYASGYSAIAYKQNLTDMMVGIKGEIEAGELALEETSGRLLPAGIFARWRAQ